MLSKRKVSVSDTLMIFKNLNIGFFNNKMRIGDRGVLINAVRIRNSPVRTIESIDGSCMLDVCQYIVKKRMHKGNKSHPVEYALFTPPIVVLSW